MLPDTFPAIAHVVSDDPYELTRTSQDFTANFVMSVFEASGDRIPFIALPISNKTMQAIKSRINSSTVAPTRKKQWLDSLILVDDARSGRWQRDPYQSFVNQKGNPVVRNIRGKGGYAEQLTSKLQAACPDISFGESLPPESEKGYPDDFRRTLAANRLGFSNEGEIRPFAGGNMGGLPGGLAMYGQGNPDSFGKYWIGAKENA